MFSTFVKQKETSTSLKKVITHTILLLVFLTNLSGQDSLTANKFVNSLDDSLSKSEAYDTSFRFYDTSSIDTLLNINTQTEIKNIQKDQSDSVKFTPKNINKNWYKDHSVLFYLFLVILTLYAIIQWKYEEYFVIMKRSISNNRVSQIYFDEFQNQFIIPTILLYTNTILAFGITFYFLLSKVSVYIHLTFWQKLIYCIVTSALFFVLKYGIQRLMVFILPISENIKFYLFNKFHIQILLGILLLPLLILLSFTTFIPFNLILGAIGLVICTITAFQLYRGMQINMKLITLYPFHFFLYLCALEITPILIIFTFHKSLFS